MREDVNWRRTTMGIVVRAPVPVQHRAGPAAVHADPFRSTGSGSASCPCCCAGWARARTSTTSAPRTGCAASTATRSGSACGARCSARSSAGRSATCPRCTCGSGSAGRATSPPAAIPGRRVQTIIDAPARRRSRPPAARCAPRPPCAGLSQRGDERAGHSSATATLDRRLGRSRPLPLPLLRSLADDAPVGRRARRCSCSTRAWSTRCSSSAARSTAATGPR